MTEYEIIIGLGKINFAPQSELEEILQNVRTIIGTRKGTVPLDRNFGIDWAFVDEPLAVAQAMLSTEVITQIKRYEPRAKVLRVGFEPVTEEVCVEIPEKPKHVVLREPVFSNLDLKPVIEDFEGVLSGGNAIRPGEPIKITGINFLAKSLNAESISNFGTSVFLTGILESDFDISANEINLDTSLYSAVSPFMTGIIDAAYDIESNADEYFGSSAFMTFNLDALPEEV